MKNRILFFVTLKNLIIFESENIFFFIQGYHGENEYYELS